MELPKNQQKFADAYLEHGNARKAYYEAGYKAKSHEVADAASSRLLSSVKVASYIASRRGELTERTMVTAERIILETAKIAFSDFNDIIEVDEYGMPKMRPGADLNSLDGISGSATDSYSDSGHSKSRSFSVKRAERLKALDMLAKMVGAYDRTEKDNSANIADSAAKILGALSKLRGKQ